MFDFAIVNTSFPKDEVPRKRGEVQFVLVAYRLIARGSEWRLHREWFERSELADLLGADGALCHIHTLYACHNRLLKHQAALFDHLVSRWRDLFSVSFDVLLHDLTSTYFECDPQAPQRPSSWKRVSHL